jgi:hypothetical protein
MMVDQKAVNSAWFQYTPLDLSARNVRLLEIQPGLTWSTIQCTIKHEPLRKNHVCLSYMWGSEKDTAVILVNGRKFLIRHNLYNFLKLARRHGVRERLWIDAICIDQANAHERNHQVRQMADCYKMAKYVLIWTGHALSDLRRVFLRLKSTQLPRREAFKLAQAEYWTRMWIIQEVLLPHDVRLFLGSEARPLAQFETALRSYKNIALMGNDVCDLIRHREGLHGLSRCPSFCDLLEQYGTQKCKDRRDRVYSLLGLDDDAKDFYVDYEEDVLLTFMRAFQYLTRSANICLRTVSHAMVTLGNALGLKVAIFCEHTLGYLVQSGAFSLKNLSCPGKSQESSRSCDFLVIPFDLLLQIPLSPSALPQQGKILRYLCSQKGCMALSEFGWCAVRFIERQNYCHLWLRVFPNEFTRDLRDVNLSTWAVLEKGCSGSHDVQYAHGADFYRQLIQSGEDWSKERSTEPPPSCTASLEISFHDGSSVATSDLLGDLEPFHPYGEGMQIRAELSSYLNLPSPEEWITGARKGTQK